MYRITQANSQEHISKLIAKRRKLMFSLPMGDLLSDNGNTPNYRRAKALTRRIERIAAKYPLQSPDYTPRVPNTPMIPAPLLCVINGVEHDAPYDIAARWQYTAGVFKFFKSRHNFKRQAKMIAYRNMARKALAS